MRIILFILLASPFFSDAQINRSANELAKENVQSYIVTKLFKDGSYKPVLYGEIKEFKHAHSEIAWTLIHDFEIAEAQKGTDNKSVVQQSYKFIFYLDKQLKVLRAEGSPMQ